MRGEAFWGLKNPENPGASGGSAPWTPAGALPLDPTRALERAPGPHAVKTLRSLRSLRSTWTETIFLQHPAVTNPAHAHDDSLQEVHAQSTVPHFSIPCVLTLEGTGGGGGR